MRARHLPRGWSIVLAAVALLLLLLGGVALAGSGYDLSWWTVDGGGYTFSTGPGYSLGGTIGQPDAGPVMAGAGYRLSGGFWFGGAALYRIYLPLTVRHSA